LLASEQAILEKHGNQFFIPLIWAQSVINIAKNEGRIKEDIAAQKLFVVRSSQDCRWDWISIHSHRTG